jgi:hypothetical protein
VAQIGKVPDGNGEDRERDMDMEKHPQRLTHGVSLWAGARATPPGSMRFMLQSECFVPSVFQDF